MKLTKKQKLEELKYQLKGTSFGFDFALNRDYSCDAERTEFLFLQKIDIEQKIIKLKRRLER